MRGTTILGSMLAMIAGCSFSRENVSAPDASGPEKELTLLDHALELSDRMADQRARAEMLADLADSLAAFGKQDPRAGRLVERSLSALQAVHAPDERDPVDIKIARVKAELGDLDGAEAIALKIGAAETRGTAVTEVIKLEAAQGSLDRAYALVSRIPTEDARGSALVALVDAAASSGKIDSAFEWAKKCPKRSQRDEAMARVARVRAREKAFAQAEKIAQTIENGHFKSEALSAIVEAEYKIGNGRRALKQASAIESSWILSRTYADLSLYARRSNRSAEAKRLYVLATKTADGISDPVMKGSAFEDIAGRAIDEGHPDEARQLAERCPSKDSKHKILARLAEYQAKAGRLEEAERTAQAIGEDPVWRAAALGSIADAYGGAGKIDRALAAVAEVPLMQLRLPILARVVAARASSTTDGSRAALEALSRSLEVDLDAPHAHR
jgi:hypothetical protein